MKWFFSDKWELPEGRASLAIFYDNDEIWYGRRRGQRYVKTDSRGRPDGGLDKDLRYVRAWVLVKRPPIPKLNYEVLAARDLWLTRLHKTEVERLMKVREEAERKKEKEGSVSSS